MRVSTDPSAATARLQVSCSARHLAGLLPAPKAHSDRPGFGHLDRAGHDCSLTRGGALVLLGVVELYWERTKPRPSRLTQSMRTAVLVVRTENGWISMGPRDCNTCTKKWTEAYSETSRATFDRVGSGQGLPGLHT